MVEGFDRVVVAVPNLAEAVEQYAALLGARPLLEPAPGGRRAWWDLGNTVLELRQDTNGSPGWPDTARIEAVVLRSASASAADTAIENPLGLQVFVCDGSAMASRLAQAALPSPCSLRVDHLVLRTQDADACIALFAVALGMRLALDKTVPEWGGRMLFFRTGKLTLEVIAPEEQAGREMPSDFWGIAYRHPDLGKLRADLAARSVAVSELREGRKPGTRVATVKSHALGIPTLLIEPPARQ
ncbi:MAG: hypothetical protein KDI09_21255 [Halioglobus sp.]|nr:hypothetical protein [Halioglobus sp.]